jgi:transposase
VTQTICGVDVSLRTLDARIGRTGPRGDFTRTADGAAALARFCTEHGVELIVMEGSGGYEKLPFGLLDAEHGLPVAIVNPRAVRRFAEAMGVLEKTDRLDAGIIAWYAAVKQVKQVKPTKLPSPTQDRLRALCTRLRQLTKLRTAQINQRRLLGKGEIGSSDAAAEVVGLIDEVIALVNRQIRTLEAKIAELIESDPLWRALDQAFREVKGVADRTVARLLAELPEIGTLSGKAIAKLAGLAPIACDSGASAGPRHIRAGRDGPREILFVVAELVSRHVPVFAAFRDKLRQAGKPKKVIRIALARKLLVVLNAKARDARRNFAAAT